MATSRENALFGYLIVQIVFLVIIFAIVLDVSSRMNKIECGEKMTTRDAAHAADVAKLRSMA